MPDIATIADDVLTVSAGSFTASISARSIERTWDALSFFPDRRARLELNDLAARLNFFAGKVDTIAAQAGAIDVTSECERFARRHIELTRRAWAVESRCMSWFIVGPARFPVARNEKRVASRDKAYFAVSAHTAAALHTVERTAFPHGLPGGPIRSSNPDAPTLIRAKIAKHRNMHAVMKAANAAIRAAKTDDRDTLVEAVHGATGLSRDTAVKICTPDFCGQIGFGSYALSGQLAEIKRLEGRLAAIEAQRERGAVERQHNTTAGAVTVIENPEAARIQLVFPGKPDAEVRGVLKANGFRWAPSHGAWQRHLNTGGRWAAERVLSQLQAEA